MPQPSAAAYVASVFAIAVVLGSAVIWIRVFARRKPGKPAIPFEPRRQVPWGLLDAAIILSVWFVLLVAMQLLCYRLMFGSAIESADLSMIEKHRAAMLGMLGTNVCSFIFGAIWLASRGATLADFGLDGPRIPHDFRLGLLAFVAAVVPVYLVQAALVQLWPSEHPLIKLLKESPDGWIILLSVLSAAIVAPIVEEFLFRLVLQGSLESAEWRVFAASNPTIPPPAEMTAEAFVESTNPYQAPSIAAGASPAGAFPVDASPPDAASADAATQDHRTLVRSLGNSKVWGLPMGVWPMTISATIFALLHAGHGPDPIPLLILALIMGYLYRQTHRLLPSIVLHMTLNSCSLLMLWLQLGG